MNLKNDEPIKEKFANEFWKRILKYFGYSFDSDVPFSLSEFIVVDHKGLKYLLIKFFVTFCSLTSSYMYAYLAAFRLGTNMSVADVAEDVGSDEVVQETDVLLYSLMILLQMVFGFHLVLQYFLSFDDGKSSKPQTNLTKIFNNYFYGNFILDFIPLIPF